MACPRHPAAAFHPQYCPACLLQQALAPADAVGPIAMETLQVQVPLGRSASASVFLARSEGRNPRLLRLKIWHTAAPPDFLDRFQHLQTRLAAWPQSAIPAPLAASVDAAGCPSVATEFRQGAPLLDRVRSGGLDAQAALGSLRAIADLMLAGHSLGLVHGSVVPGNVLVRRGSRSLFLVDFGLAPLLAGPERHGSSAAGDVAGFAALSRALRDIARGEPPVRL